MADDFEATIGKIIEQTGISRDELMRRIREKQDQLGIVTLEGAAILVGKEMKVRM